jgi:hypothetical protein
MPVYRARLMDTDDHIELAWVFEADCDEQALEIAKQYVDRCDVELWDGERKVAYLTAQQ